MPPEAIDATASLTGSFRGRENALMASGAALRPDEEKCTTPLSPVFIAQRWRGESDEAVRFASAHLRLRDPARGLNITVWRFRKSFSPLPGVRLTLSPSGLSTSVGFGPFRVTSGRSGVHLTTSVPGTGLSYRQRLLPGAPGGGDRGSPAVTAPAFEPTPASAPDPRFEQIESAQSEVLTTAGIAEFRRLLDQARALHGQTSSDLDKANAAEAAAVQHYLSWKNGWLLRRVLKKKFSELAAKAEESTARRVELQEQEELARLGLQIDMPAKVKDAYKSFCEAFATLSASSRIWDTVSHRVINQFAERTQAGRAIDRKPVRFGLGQCPVIRSDWSVPHLENANGGDLYLYPLFIVYFAGERSFALLEYKDVELVRSSVKFHEEEAIPPDSTVVGRTWAKTNKDGSPDRRFKGNYEIPLAQYGRLVFQSSTGLNEEYMVSNHPNCAAFERAWVVLQQRLAEGA